MLNEVYQLGLTPKELLDGEIYSEDPGTDVMAELLEMPEPDSLDETLDDYVMNSMTRGTFRSASTSIYPSRDRTHEHISRLRQRFAFTAADVMSHRVVDISENVRLATLYMAGTDPTIQEILEKENFERISDVEVERIKVFVQQHSDDSEVPVHSCLDEYCTFTDRSLGADPVAWN